MLNPRLEFLIWCNGSHYYPARDGSCRWSGYGDNRRLHQFCEEHGTWSDRAYATLHRAGLPERDLLQILLVPLDEVHLTVTPCGAPVARQTADLVQARNGAILELFPKGLLRDELTLTRRPEPPVWFARRVGDRDTWTLVDPRHVQRWKGVPGRASASASLDVRDRAAEALGITWDDVERAMRGASETLVAEMFDCGDYPPLVMDGRLHRLSSLTEELVREQYPLIPRGHLLFEDFEAMTPGCLTTACS